MLSTKDIVLLLLSSVLVSSEESQNKKEERINSKEEKESDKIGEAVATKEGASHPQFTKQLEAKWTFWYEANPHHEKGRPINKSDYLKDVKRGKSFDTIAAFWDCWREVQTVCNQSEDCNYELFKHGVKPVWEDPKNIRGGKCVLSLPRALLEDAMKQWVTLMITLLIGEFGPDVNGVVLSRRSWGDIFSVWVRNANDKDAVDSTMRHLHELFGKDATIRFQRHQTSIRKKVNPKPLQLGTQNTQPTLEKKLSESEGSSSEGEHREKNKGKEDPRRNSMINEVRADTHHPSTFGRQVYHPPIDRVTENKGVTFSRGVSAVGTSKLRTEESSSQERAPNYLKRKLNTSAPQSKPVVKKEVPSIAELSTQEITIGLALCIAAVATSILSWIFLY